MTYVVVTCVIDGTGYYFGVNFVGEGGFVVVVNDACAACVGGAALVARVVVASIVVTPRALPFLLRSILQDLHLHLQRVSM